ncbi:MAG: hypothetical protein EZS28_037769, partial [Streblomastix strix]
MVSYTCRRIRRQNLKADRRQSQRVRVRCIVHRRLHPQDALIRGLFGRAFSQ